MGGFAAQKMTDLIDLHVHTTASDGALSPTEVVGQAKKTGLAALAVTDHDTVAGIDEAIEAGVRVEVIAGIEFSIATTTPGYLHMLGLLIDHRHPALAEPLERITASRAERNAKIVAQLNQLGLELSLEEVGDLSGGGQIGRAHIGQAMVNRGYVTSLNEAFDKHLKKGRPAYQDRFRLTPAEAIDLIHRAGGLAVIAHPVSTGLKGPKLTALLGRFKDEGLDGVEVYCPSQDEAARLFLAEAAARKDLLVSGGSDFHGYFKPEIRIGWGRGDLRVRSELLDRLRARSRPGSRTRGR